MKCIGTLVLVMASAGFANSQDQWENVYRESAWKERDKWQQAEEIIRKLGVGKGSTVADIGCHEGYMTLKLSKAVQDEGKVYAVDVDQSKLTLLSEHLKVRKINNVTVIKGDYDNPKLPANAVDAVIILDTYHEMDDHEKILQHVLIALKKGGRLVLCEPLEAKRKGLPRKEQEAKHELGINYALEDLKNAGFEIAYQQDPFVDRIVKGDQMWLIVATKK